MRTTVKTMIMKPVFFRVKRCLTDVIILIKSYQRFQHFRIIIGMCGFCRYLMRLSRSKRNLTIPTCAVRNLQLGNRSLACILQWYECRTVKKTMANYLKQKKLPSKSQTGKNKIKKSPVVDFDVCKTDIQPSFLNLKNTFY